MEENGKLSPLDEAYRAAAEILWNYLAEKENRTIKCSNGEQYVMDWHRNENRVWFGNTYNNWNQEVDNIDKAAYWLKLYNIISMTSGEAVGMWSLKNNALTDPETLLQVNGRCYTLKQISEIFESLGKSVETYRNYKGKY